MPNDTTQKRDALGYLRWTADEFLHGIWWVSDGAHGLRDASLSECATEIKRLRGVLTMIAKQDWAWGDPGVSKVTGPCARLARVALGMEEDHNG